MGLVRLQNYYTFIKDERGNWADHIFESNVRGFQQNTLVNIRFVNRFVLASKRIPGC